MDIDLYEFKDTLSSYNDAEDFVEIQTDKTIGLIDVDKAPIEIKNQLKENGYSDGDKVLVVIQ